MLKKKLILLLCVVLAMVFHAEAQFGKKKKSSSTGDGINYSLILNQAEDDFERGNLSKIPANLQKGFVKNGFSKEEVIQAHRLLTLVHLFSDNEPSAELELIQLLKSDPEHPINPLTDPSEFQILYKKFRTKPIFRIAFNAGITSTRVNRIQAFSTINSNLSDDTETFTPKIGTQLGIAIEKEVFNTGFELSLGAIYSSKKYESRNTIIGGEPNADGDIGDAFSIMTQTDAANYLDIPLLLRYNLNLKNAKIVPFIFGGVEANLLLSAARRSGQRTGAQTISAGEQKLKASEERNNQNYAIVGGAGFKYKLKTHFFKFEVKYSNGLTNVVNPDNRYVNPTTVFRLAQVDNNQSLNVISVNIGYVLSIYNPKKLKKYRN